eukprot:CAMPEP_0203955212 /NCGR_PEP_ID=MMETSP0359-20131031/87932_1 /ASSEMBLY_ACC=CAM_ASM_000338 /TAXON_ID=268821 /ORGANISM="Scrippsiella Hangoei, Strain SHTV-5" /LENGTH=76 /DNA_ID=CAMNT_0050888813 /DNA_START=92 /DNA_END=322 /DNA_ORIENTATION=-
MRSGNFTIVFATCESTMPSAFSHCTFGFKLSSRVQPMSEGNFKIAFDSCESSMPKPFNQRATGFDVSSRRDRKTIG